MYYLQGPSPLRSGVMNASHVSVASSSGAAGVFHTDPSRTVLAISVGIVTKERDEEQQHYFTFVVRPSILIGLASRECRGIWIGWEEWKEKATMINRCSHPTFPLVEGSRVFFFMGQESRGDEGHLVVYHFSPGAHKERGNMPYTSRHFNFNITPSVGQRSKWWEVSGDTVVLFDVRSLKFIRARLVLKSTPATWGCPKCPVLQRHHLVCLNLWPSYSGSRSRILQIPW